MERVTCPYCQSEVSMAEVEKESGACPECGAIMSGSVLFDSDNEMDDDLDDLDDLDD